MSDSDGRPRFAGRKCVKMRGNMIQDFRYALRNLLRRRSMAAVAILTLGLGIGGATSVFSVVDAVVLKPLPYSDPDRLLRIWELTRDGDRFSFSDSNYLDLRSSSRALQSVAAYRELGTTMVLSAGGEPQRIVGVPIAAAAADVLGVRPALGRMFTADEDRARSPDRLVVLGDGVWRRRFGADPQIVGRSVTVDAVPFVVSRDAAAIRFPRARRGSLCANGARSRRKELAVFGRLSSRRDLAQARGGCVRSGAGYRRASRVDGDGAWMASLQRMDRVTQRDRCGGFCSARSRCSCCWRANVANLLVADATSRREMGKALGAARGQLVLSCLRVIGAGAHGTGAGVMIGRGPSTPSASSAPARSRGSRVCSSTRRCWRLPASRDWPAAWSSASRPPCIPRASSCAQGWTRVPDIHPAAVEYDRRSSSRRLPSR